MEKSVYKYSLPFADRAAIELPEGAKVLNLVEIVDMSVTIWAEVDPSEEKKVQRVFFVVGTGQLFEEVDGDGEAIHHATCRDGFYIWHLYERVHPALEIVQEEM